jgi:GntR family transcriptional regulator of arabinose operon
MTKGVNFDNPAHLYEQIVADIRGKIVAGELKPGDRLETQAELATKYNVSLITVKNALALLVNEGLLFSRAGKGTFVLESQSKGLNLSEHKTIGLVLRDLKHPYFSMIVHSVEERAYEMGFNVLLSGSSGNIEKEESQIDKFRTMGVDGLVIASLSLEYRATDYIQRLHGENFPYVMVSYIHDPDFWYVGSDQELGGYMATEHLIRTGYRSVGYVHMGGKNLLSEVRKNGYARALMEFDRPYDADAVFTLDPARYDFGTDRFQLGSRFARDFASSTRKPEALFFYNDMCALGFIQGATDAGMRVPEDIAVVGFDDATVAQYASVPLTTIHQPVDKIGRMAVEIIQKRIQNIATGNRTILKPTLIIRDSCGAKKKTPGDHSLSRTEDSLA